MKKIKLEIVGLSYSQTQSGAYALVLGEARGKRRLPIIIGGFEAQAIAIELEKISPSRPLTHDLFKNLSDNFNITINEVIIYNLVEGIFFAKLICTNGEKEVEIDTRTSDAIALAVRFKCPVFTYEFILSSAGIILEEGASPEAFEGTHEEEAKEDKKKGNLGAASENELKEMLKNAIDEENYEKASKIRDEISSRKKSN
ncbi:MAG: bifunctional nuclease family protein [Bacteroidetes bacterium]|nr:bifunctional nuclease family protein [Bacteroidota bacterium]HET6243504.1 bifunctional nuclease family protein [Bacteroidia bacterium]